MDSIIKLVDGKIPAHTVCPFRSVCGSASDGNCNHQGVNHKVAYSCGSARAFEMITYEKPWKE